MVAVVAGYFCLDIAPDLSHMPEGQFRALFQPGRLLQIGEARFAGGGVVSASSGLPSLLRTILQTGPRNLQKLSQNDLRCLLAL